MTPAEQYKAARELIQQNLLEIADELHEWGKTALLRDGKLRKAARLLEHETFKFQALRMVEDTAYKLMAEHLSGQFRSTSSQPRCPAHLAEPGCFLGSCGSADSHANPVR